jgi:predicted transposase YdaD
MEGREEERENAARNLSAMGMAAGAIARALDLPVEKVRSFVT